MNNKMSAVFTLLFWTLFIFLSIAHATETTSVKLQLLDTLVEMDGRLEASSQSTVSAQVNATIKKIYVDVDDKVAAGTLLLELDDTELTAQLAKANASLKAADAQYIQAKSEFKRLQELKSSRFISDSEMTSAQAAVEISEANINLATAQIAQVTQQLTYTKIIAPYSGVVTGRHVEVGENARVGTPLLTGYALNQNRVVVYVPNSLIELVESNQSLLVMYKADKWLEVGDLTVAPSVDPQTHTVMIRANIDKTLLQQRPGSFVKVAIKTGTRSAPVIPISSVIKQGDLTAVYVQLGEHFVLRQVVLAQAQDDWVEVISGLSVTDTVVTNAATYLARVPTSQAQQ